jgi:Delta24-sterol reductase
MALNYWYLAACILIFLLRKKIADALVELSFTKYRWITVLTLVLPLSFVFNWWEFLRNKYVFWARSAPKQHDERVKVVQESIKNRKPNQSMCTARPTWQATSLFHPKYKETSFKVDLSSFMDVLEVDTTRRVVRVEPGVTCGQLTNTLTPLGWTTAVVPELDDLTVGGLIAGFGVETSSHIYGLFQHICESFEVILADGTLVKCSATENSDLFYNIPWSYGTLGFLVAAEVKIVPSRKYIHVKYEPCYSKDEYVKLLDKYSREGKVDYVEALAYSKDRAVVMTGMRTDDCEKSKLNTISRFFKPWFYKHVEGFLKSGASDEYIPTADYFHRHTKSIFWEMEDILPFGNHPLFRYTLGWLVPPKVSFLKLTSTKRVLEMYKFHHADQDMLVPMRDLGKTIDVFEENFTIYPLWLCPCKIPKTHKRGLVNPLPDGDDMFIDVGAYGVPHVQNYDPDRSHRTVEEFVRKVGGFQALYAATYQTKQELETMFDHTAYYELRKRYSCDGAFPVIYDKVCRTTRNH